MMRLEQRHWTPKHGWTPATGQLEKADLVFVFGETQALKSCLKRGELAALYPGAQIFGCSTAGEIQDTRVYDDTICITAIRFAHTQLLGASLHLAGLSSYAAGEALARKLNPEGLSHVFVLSAGLNVNGSELVKGLTATLPSQVTITGGLAGDKDRFQETFVVCNADSGADLVAVMGLYGRHIHVSSASLGGWDPFGPERMITKSEGNVLYELDGKSALELYKTYLGEHAQGLPSSALLFPLSLKNTTDKTGLVRTVLAVDEAKQSMTFAGDVPVGSRVQLMKANFDRLIEGAIGAAENSQLKTAASHPELALLISCVGRKIVLKQRIEEEVEGVREIFGPRTILTGFYSYGEISPFTPNAKCELHNQTMTITTLYEDEKRAA